MQVASWPQFRESLDDLPPLVAQAMRDCGNQRQWRRGQVVLMQGQALSAVVVCLQGRLDIRIGAPSGQDTLLRWLRQGEVIGLTTVLAGMPCPATIVAAGPATTLHVAQQAFLDILQRHPDGAIAVSVLLSHRLAELFRFVEMTWQRPLRDRVRYALARLAQQHGEPAEPAEPADVGMLRLRITQAELAAAAGASRQRVHLELLQLQTEGVLRLGYRTILVWPHRL